VVGPTGATSPAAAVTLSAFIRVGLTGLSSHWAMTAVSGAGVGFLAGRGPRRGALPAAACLAVAMLMHFQFDDLRPPLLMKVVLNFVTVAACYAWLRHGYRARARAALAARAAAGIVPASEAPTLLTRGFRRYRLRRTRSRAERADVSARQQSDLDGIEEEAADWPRARGHGEGPATGDRGRAFVAYRP
jgi:hypothetical protein